MTDTPPNNPAREPHAELRPELRNWCEAWKACLQNVLSQVSGQPAAFEISSEPLAATDSDLWYTVVAGGATRGEMTLRLSIASGICLAQKFLGEPDPAADGIASQPFTPDHKDSLEELLRQTAGLAATTLASAAGGEVQFHLSPAAPSWSSDAMVCLQTRNEAGTAITLEIRISPALVSALQSPLETAATAATSPQTSPPPPPLPSTVPSASYSRLMDVGLDVKLRFGTRRMFLRDVLGLSAGVVVELDNPLHSPVDLLLDGRLIAQGEVVIVDGKYGLRVTDVADHAPSAGSPG
jgi:flagellar motor switch protein FliN/FliY